MANPLSLYAPYPPSALSASLAGDLGSGVGGRKGSEPNCHSGCHRGFTHVRGYGVWMFEDSGVARSQQGILAVSAKPSSITEIDLERGFDVVRSKAASSADGVFGPGSTIWQVDREALVFLGAGRALLLQLAHPWVATAIAQHSKALSDPIGRFHRTFEIVFTLVFGSLEQALATSRRLHRRHAAISGHLPERLGPYAKGSPYRPTRSPR